MIYPVTMSSYLKEEEIESYSDEQLLEASLSHPSMFAYIVRKYEAPFLRKAMSIVHSEEESEDIVQEAFTKIYLNAKKFKKVDGATFSSWAYRILINTALTHYMKSKRERGTRADLEPEILELIPDKNLEQFGKKELTDEVASILGRMPQTFARALAAFFLEGKTQEEMAQEEGISVGAIKTRVHRAKREFKKVYNAITTP